MKQTSEAAFETAIEAVLLDQGYSRVDGKGFDRERVFRLALGCTRLGMCT